MLPAYKGTRDAVLRLGKQEGVRGLYAGLAPSLLGSAVAWGAYLYLYEHIKEWHRGRQEVERLSVGGNLMSAAQAGAMVSSLMQRQGP
jgi:hypothetical protein